MVIEIVEGSNRSLLDGGDHRHKIIGRNDAQWDDDRGVVIIERIDFASELI